VRRIRTCRLSLFWASRGHSLTQPWSFVYLRRQRPWWLYLIFGFQGHLMLVSDLVISHPLTKDFCNTNYVVSIWTTVGPSGFLHRKALLQYVSKILHLGHICFSQALDIFSQRLVFCNVIGELPVQIYACVTRVCAPISFPLHCFSL
jgi:hypothetical protein